jgi:hypothetical protein
MGQTQGSWYSPDVALDGPRVYLNVYDLDKHWLNMNSVLGDALQIGGAFHVGVEVWGTEWSFGADGVVYSPARHHEVHVYRQSLPLGNTRLDKEHVSDIVNDMAGGDWTGGTYDILCRNCCTFARELCYRLLQGRDRIPGWVDRLGNGLAGVLGPVGMSGYVAPAPPRAHSFNHVRQDSTASQFSVCSSVQEVETPPVTPRGLHHTQPVHHYPHPLMTSQSFGHLPVHHESRLLAAPPHKAITPFGMSTVWHPPPIATGVRRFVSAVY